MISRMREIITGGSDKRPVLSFVSFTRIRSKFILYWIHWRIIYLLFFFAISPLSSFLICSLNFICLYWMNYFSFRLRSSKFLLSSFLRLIYFLFLVLILFSLVFPLLYIIFLVFVYCEIFLVQFFIFPLRFSTFCRSLPFFRLRCFGFVCHCSFFCISSSSAVISL